MLWARVRSLVCGLFRRSRVEREMTDELQFHLEARTNDLIAKNGLSREDARRRARLEFGSTEGCKEEARQARGLRLLDELRADLKFALRMLNRNRALASVAILSLALGIGANTVVFSVINGLLLRPLPIESPERLYFVNNNLYPGQSFPNYKDIRDRNIVFSSLFMYRMTHVSLEHGDGARLVWGYLASGNYFESLGIRPAVGRFFTPEEDISLNANPYAVLSYDYWQSHFSGDRVIVGQTVRVNTRPYTVLGVAPKGFHGTEVFYWPDVWLPLTMQSQIEGRSWLDRRQDFNGWVAGRLKPGVSPQQADENLRIIADTLAQQYTINEGMRLTVGTPGLAGSFLRSPVSAFSSAVMLLSVLVLLAACVNIACLLLARLTDRSRELAIRLSLGAGGRRIIRQLLTESLLISLLGGLAGLAIAFVLLDLLGQWHVPAELPIQFEVYPDLRVFLFTLSAAVLTGGLFGTATAFRTRSSNPSEGLKGTVMSARGRRWALRDVLLVVQIAICCLLVTASFVAVRGLTESFHTYLGLRPAGAAVIGYDLKLAEYTEEEGRRFHARALEAISQIPGVTDYALARSVPLSLDLSSTLVYPEETTDFRPTNAILATNYTVSPGYFRAMGTKLIEGREFTSRDSAGSPPTAIINETFARRVLGKGPWVGRRYRTGQNSPPVDVVGVVEDGKYWYLTEPPTPVMFLPILRRYSGEAMLIARSSRPEADVASDMRRVISGMDPRIPIYTVGSMTQFLNLVMLPAQVAVISLGAFGVLAAMLALTGIYGLAAYTVAQRTREIGIRVAIGAQSTNILRLIFGRTTALVALGSVAGITLGSLSSRLLSRFIVGVSPGDPLVLAGATVSMLLIAIAAAWRPLRRALSVDPAQALRWE